MKDTGNIRRAVVASQILEAMNKQGISRKGLADKMGRTPSEVTRWLSGNHNFTIDLLSELSEALGVQITGVASSLCDGYEPCILNDSAIASYTCGADSAGAVQSYRYDSAGAAPYPYSVGPVNVPADCYRSLQRKAAQRGEDIKSYVKGVLIKDALAPAVNVWDFCGIVSDTSAQEMIADVRSHRCSHKEIIEL